MATTLTSNPFLPTLGSRFPKPLAPYNSRLLVFAKKEGSFPSLRLRNRELDGGAEGVAATEENAKPFFFKFGKISDVKSLVPVLSSPSSAGLFGNPRRKDPNAVFVAGATGQAGLHIAQTLLRQGFTVRAGVSDLSAAQELARLAATYKFISKEELQRLNAVDSSFQDAESIAKGIGNASKVVVTIGPSEDGPTAEVTTADALRVVEAAQLAGVSHVAIIYDGYAATTSTYNVLDGISSFFGNLFARSQPLTMTEFLERVVSTTTDVSYTVIKTSLTDDFSPESAYNVVVSAERKDPSTNDYKVTKSKIASMVAEIFSNIPVAENKVVEVFTDPSAQTRPFEELFSAIPEDGRRKAYAEGLAKERAEEEARIASKRAQEAAEAAKRLEEEVKKLSEQEARAARLSEEAEEKAATAGTSVESLLSKAKDIGSGLSWEKFSSQLSAAVPKPDGPARDGPKVQIATVRGQAKARALSPKKAAVVKQQPALKFPKFATAKEESKRSKEKQTEVNSVFGGLFKQETIYIDDD